jgi:CRISPR-associated endonuclease/helicase Cas3
MSEPTLDDILYPYQQRVYELVRQKKRIIIQAPTGGGKTRAALAPYIEHQALYHLAKTGAAYDEAQALAQTFPLTCRYAVPMRVLANQFYREYDELAKRIDAETGSRLVELYKSLNRPASAVQTGETPDDPQFESMLTFCTIDQLLASALAVPYSVGNARANINVGAIASSYLVFDEFHLYPLLREGKSVQGARTTTLALLRLLSPLTPFVLMTATFSTKLLERLATLLDAEIVSVTGDELVTLNHHRTRIFHRSLESMSAHHIVKVHQRRRQESGEASCTLVICNTVERAQKAFLDIRAALPEDTDTTVRLLHSRFTTEDRQRFSKEIEEQLGPAQWKDGHYLGKDMIVVATQVVEVGLNISVQTLHTELAPANSLVQRAGRCARFERQQGEVIIYPLPLTEDHKPVSALPYQESLCDATWYALEQLDGQVVGFREEQQLIDVVHTQEDQELLDRYEREEPLILEEIFKSFNHNDRGLTTPLIRDVAQIQILIHDTPKETITEEPWFWQSFGAHPSLLQGKRWAALQERKNELGLEWACKQAIPLEVFTSPEDADLPDSRQKTRYTWDEITNPRQVATAFRIVLPRQLATYDRDLGFALLDGSLPVQPGDYQSENLKGSKFHDKHFVIRATRYEDHIAGLRTAYFMRIKEEVAYIAHRLEVAMELPEDMVDFAIRLAIGCHDLGKLNRQWQQWALAWQKLLYEKEQRPEYQKSANFCFAKTDNYKKEHQQWQREVRPKKPHHACESVAISRSFIGHSLGISKDDQRAKPVLQAICGAIARHHTPQACKYSGPISLDKAAQEAAKKALQEVLVHSHWKYDLTKLKFQVADGGDLAPISNPEWKITRPGLESERIGILETWLYFVIARALRIVDQRA